MNTSISQPGHQHDALDGNMKNLIHEMQSNLQQISQIIQHSFNQSQALLGQLEQYESTLANHVNAAQAYSQSEIQNPVSRSAIQEQQDFQHQQNNVQHPLGEGTTSEATYASQAAPHMSSTGQPPPIQQLQQSAQMHIQNAEHAMQQSLASVHNAIHGQRQVMEQQFDQQHAQQATAVPTNSEQTDAATSSAEPTASSHSNEAPGEDTPPQGL